MNHEMQDATKHEDAAATQPPLPPAPAPPAPPVPPAAHAPYQPVSDLDVAAQYAEMEIQSVATQFAGASVNGAAQPPAIAAAANGGVASASDDDEDDEDATEDDAAIESSSEESSDDDDDDEEDRNKLRAEIEAAMEKEENKASSVPLKTVNEIAATPVREPGVELTADCPIARCGTILNVSVPGLMVTIKSDMNTKPLDEGSVLCFEDRAVLGCVDEVFGPVMMPMYLVRFENAEKMPAQATINSVVFFATEHTTYIVPEKIKDKGTDASNIFDEETDETLYSDDEAEAAAKRQNRKRNRGGQADQPHIGGSDNATSEYTNNRQHNASFTEYRQGSSGSGSSYGGRGGGRSGGGRGGSGRGGGGRGNSDSFSHNQPVPVQFQTQTHGGHTHYTQPGYAAPAPLQHMGYASQSPMGYAPPPPTGYQPPPPPPMQYNPAMQMNPHQPPPPQHPYPQHPQPPQHFQTQHHQYQQPPHMVPYPPQAPPMPGQQQFYQPGPPPQQQYHGAPPQYPPKPPTGYYPNTQPQQQQPPLPPGAYDHSRQPRN